MGQVPTTAAQPAIAIIGSGRAAKHFTKYLTLLKIPFTQWERSSSQPFENAVAGVKSVLVLITDSEIDPFIESHHYLLKNKNLVHFSGSLKSKFALSAHPLMTFPEGEYFDLQTYSNIPFVLEKGSPEVKELIPGIDNKSYFIDPSDKAFYHALCVLSGNFSMLLWNKLFEEFETRLGIPRQAAFPYLVQVFESTIRDSKKNLTGPLVRDDKATIGANLDALRDDPFFEVYAAFLQAYKRAEEEDTYEYQ